MLCMPLDEQESRAASDLVRALGLDNARAYAAHSHCHGWRHHHRRPRADTWALALAGRIGIAPAKLEWANVIVLDLDLGHGLTARDLAAATPAALESAPTDRGMDHWLRATRNSRSRAARMRAYCAGTVRLLLERLRTIAPSICALAESSPGGAHIVIPVDEPTPCAELHAIGRSLVAQLGSDVGPIEVFPTPDGRMCRAPLTGRARLLGPDGETPLHARRADDRQTLLEGSRTPIATLPRIDGKNPVKTLGAHQNEGTPGFHQPRGKLQGGAYVEAVAKAYDEGIGEGQSWSAARRWSFALVVGLGLSVDDAVLTFRALLERDNHRAKHCRSKAGRQRLLSTFRSCARRHRRAVESGEVTPRLKHPRLLAIFGALGGRRVEVPAARTHASVTFAKTDDADPVRARIAASRARRSEQAARAARARHHAEEAPCPSSDDLFVNRTALIHCEPPSLASPTLSGTESSPPPTSSSPPTTSGQAPTSPPRSSLLATLASTRRSRARAASSPTSPVTSTPSLHSSTRCSPRAPSPAPTPFALEAAS